MLQLPAARARIGAAGLAAAAALAGCSQTAATTSSVTATGQTLSIWMSVPPSISADTTAQQVIDAEQLAFHAHSAQVTNYRLRLVLVSRGKLSDNARAAIQDKSAIAYLGELAPGDSEQTVGITNALDLLQVSPTDTALELTTRTPAVPKAPDRYYETLSTYGRTFARVAPDSAAEASAQVAEMKALHVTSLHVADDGTDYGRAIARAVSADATTVGIASATSLSGAGAFFFGGGPAAAARAFAGSSSSSMKLFGDSALDTSSFLSALGSTAPGQLYISVPTAPASGMQTLRRAFSAGAAGAGLRYPAAAQQTLSPAAAYGYEAMSALLSAIQSAGRQANDRAKVVTAFDGLRRDRTSLLGAYSLNRVGSTTLGASAFAFYRVRGGAFVPVARPRR